MSERRGKVRFGAEGEESVAESGPCWLMAKDTVVVTDVKWDVKVKILYEPAKCDVLLLSLGPLQGRTFSV